MSPVANTWGPFSAKIFLKIWFCKIDPLLPPHIDFNTIPYFTYGYPYRGVKEGMLKTITKNCTKEVKKKSPFTQATANQVFQTDSNRGGKEKLWSSSSDVCTSTTKFFKKK